MNPHFQTLDPTLPANLPVFMQKLVKNGKISVENGLKLTVSEFEVEVEFKLVWTHFLESTLFLQTLQWTLVTGSNTSLPPTQGHPAARITN